MSTLKLVARGKGSSCRLEATTDTSFLDLLKQLKAGLGLTAVPDGDLVERVKVLTGFPPKPLSLAADELIDGHLQNMGSLKVEVAESTTTSTAEAAPKVPAKKKAPAAKPTKAKKAAAAPTPAKATAVAPGRPNIHTLGGGSGPGRGKSIGGGSSTSGSSSGGGGGGAGAKRRKLNIGGSADQVSSTLLSAMQSGAGGGEDTRFWRRVMSSAVGNQYETTKAVDRVTASRASNWTVTDDAASGRLGNGSAACYVVHFPMEASSKKSHEDSGLTPYSRNEVCGVVREVHSDAKARDMLKPENMALCSPRVFWAVLRHGNQLLNAQADLGADGNDSGNATGGSSGSSSSSSAGSTESIGLDLPASLAQLLPDLDWGFLRERARARSAKALENDRQAARLDGGVEEGEDNDNDVKMAAGQGSETNAAANLLEANGDTCASKPTSAAAAAAAAASLPTPSSSPAVAAAAAASLPTARERALAAAEQRQAQQQSTVAARGGSDSQASDITTTGPPSTSAGAAPVASAQDNPATTSEATVAKNATNSATTTPVAKEEDCLEALAAVVGNTWAHLCTAHLPSLLASTDLVAALADQTDPIWLAARLREFNAAGTGASCTNTAAAAAPSPSESDVIQWIEAARNREATRAMHAIVNGTMQKEDSHDHYLSLVEQLAAIKVRTVRDLALWAKRPKVLRNMLAKQGAKHQNSRANSTSSTSSSSSSSNAGIIASPEELLPEDDASILEWATSAQVMMAARPWMETWSTKV